MKNIEYKTIVLSTTTPIGAIVTPVVKEGVKTIQSIDLEEKSQVKINKVGSEPAVAHDKKPFTSPSMEIIL